MSNVITAGFVDTRDRRYEVHHVSMSCVQSHTIASVDYLQIEPLKRGMLGGTPDVTVPQHL